MKKLLLLALGGGILFGCYSTLNAFDKRMAKLGCINARECQSAAFSEEYDSLGDCVDDVKAELDETFSGCSYDPSRGRSCIHAVYKLRKHCDFLDMSSLPECSGAVTCVEDFSDDGTLAREIARGFVSPGVGAPGSVPLDSPVDLDEAVEDGLAAIE